MNRSFSKIRHILESNKKLENRLINEQGPSGTQPTPPTDYLGRGGEMERQMQPNKGMTNKSLPDCIEFIQTTREFVVGERPGDESQEPVPGNSKVIRGLDIEYFTDGGPNYQGIYLTKDGKRFCFTKTN